MKKKVVIVAANPAVSTTTGWPVGFWASEVAHPYKVFTEAGFAVTIASPEGGKLEMDALSDPEHESGYSAWDQVSKEVLAEKEFKAALVNTPAITDLTIADFDALLVAGGQAPMFNFEVQPQLHQFFAHFYESGKITAALCHGTAVLRYAKLTSGEYLAAGKKITGFTNEEEDDADKASGVTLMPWRIEDALTSLGAYFQKGDKWTPFVAADGNLITGQQNMSGELLAREVVKQLAAQQIPA